jgi:hypothetical protein
MHLCNNRVLKLFLGRFLIPKKRRPEALACHKHFFELYPEKKKATIEFSKTS